LLLLSEYHNLFHSAFAETACVSALLHCGAAQVTQLRFGRRQVMVEKICETTTSMARRLLERDANRLQFARPESDYVEDLC
jgi:hypothetical protein